MTRDERQLLGDLKTFFENKYKKEWKTKFLNYTKTLVNDGHIDQEVVDYFMEDNSGADEIVKRFKDFLEKKPKTKSSNNSSIDGCGFSFGGDGCGFGGSSSSSKRSNSGGNNSPSRSMGGDGCSFGGSSSPSRC